MIVEAAAQRTAESPALADQLRFLDERITREGRRLVGVAGELDRVRRYLRTLLDDLPLGACALDAEGRVVLWNRALARLTGVDDARAAGQPLAALPSPWDEALGSHGRVHDLASQPETGTELTVTTPRGARRLRVHASRVQAGDASSGVIVLVEDVSERRTLEA